MSEQNGNCDEPVGNVCPECAAPRTPDGTPSCRCGPRAAEALRDTRTAEAAAAEDFDPLRIRPYVELDGDPEGAPEPSAPPTSPWEPYDIQTLAMPVASTTTRPDSADVRLFEHGTPERVPERGSGEPIRETPGPKWIFETPGPGSDTPTTRFPSPKGPRDPRDSKDPRDPRGTLRRRRRMTLALAGAVATVLAATGFASGLFSYDTPTRDKALPDDLRQSLPDTSTDGDASAPAPSGNEPATRPSPPSPTPTPSKSPSPSPSESRSSAPPSRSPSPTPTTPAPNVTATKSPGSGNRGQQRRPQVLRLGDDGPEVTELQLRLRQLGIYNGDINENFDEQVDAAVRQYQFTRGITDDEPGVYGLTTRGRLESETQEP